MPQRLAKLTYKDGSHWNPNAALGTIVGTWGPEILYEPTDDFRRFCHEASSPYMIAPHKSTKWEDMPDFVVRVVDYIPAYGLSFYGAKESIEFMD